MDFDLRHQDAKAYYAGMTPALLPFQAPKSDQQPRCLTLHKSIFVITACPSVKKLSEPSSS